MQARERPLPGRREALVVRGWHPAGHELCLTATAVRGRNEPSCSVVRRGKPLLCAQGVEQGMLGLAVKTCAGLPTSRGFAPSSTTTATRFTLQPIRR